MEAAGALDFDKYFASVSKEVDNIKEQVQERKKIYQKCMENFKQHLETETEQLDKTNLKAELKNNLIRQQFQHIYDTINQGSDTLLRQIRNTFQIKTQFWKQTINDYVDETDLELKRELYQAKKYAEENYFQAIEERKNNPIPYTKLVVVSERDKALSNFQQSNRKLQTNVYAGTMTRMTQERKNYLDNKENTMFDNWGAASQQKFSESNDVNGFLGRFMKQ